MNTKQRIKLLEKLKPARHGEQIPILSVVQYGDIIKTIDDVEVGTDETSQAEARKRIDQHPRSDYTPTVIIIQMPNNGRE